MRELSSDEFAIEIEYDKTADRPSRVFEAMADIFNAIQDFDSALLRSLDLSDVRPLLILDSVESGSIRSIARYALERWPDDAVNKLDWKAAIGPFVNRALRNVFERLADGKPIIDVSPFLEMGHSLVADARQLGLPVSPIAVPIPARILLQHASRFNDAQSVLGPGDSVTFLLAREEPLVLERHDELTQERIEALLTRDSYTYNQPMILKVKRPDYLGEAMWEFRYDGHVINVKVTDVDWLNRFRSRSVILTPGDAIRGTVEVTVNHGFDGEVIAKHYNLFQVDDVIRTDAGEQLRLT